MLTSYLIISVNEDIQDNRKVLTLTKENKIQIQDFKEFLSPDCPGPTVYNYLSSDFGGAFIDLDMDCRPDLLLETHGSVGRIQELYVFTEKGFCFKQGRKVPAEYGFISFVDLSQRGATDAIFVTKDLEVHVYRNRDVLGDGSVNLESKDQLRQISKINLCVQKDTANAKGYWPFLDYSANQPNNPTQVSLPANPPGILQVQT